MSILYEDELKHYGVPGMKWGVRKDRSKGGGGGSKSPGPKKASSMTNKELQAAVQRLNLERQYNTLTGQTSASAATKKIVGEVTRDIVKSTVKKAAVAAIGVGVAKVVSTWQGE